jgi:hypothetical protein
MYLIIKPNKYYLYHHIIPNTNEVFYVGVGNASRITSFRKSSRNKMWTEQFNKTGFIVKVIKEFDNMKEAYREEVKNIEELRSLGVKLANISGGGRGGQKGVKPWNAGIKNPFSKETLKKLSDSGKLYYSKDENKTKHAKKCGSTKEFKAIDKKTKKVAWQGYSQSDCAKKLNLMQGCISRVLHKKTLTHKGYTFEYIK